MTTKAEIKQRRKDMSKLIFKGFDKHKVFEKIADKYGVSEKTLENDWALRNKWMMEVWDLSDDEDIINDIIAEHKLVKEMYYDTYREAVQESTKIGALKGVRKCNKEILEMLQSMGVISKEPNKLELTGKDGSPIEITQVAKLADEWDDDEK